MLRLYKCCVQPFFERFVLFFCLKIERFVPETAEIWICGLYMVTGKLAVLSCISWAVFVAGCVYFCLFQLAVYNNRTVDLNAKMTNRQNMGTGLQNLISGAAFGVPLLMNFMLTTFFGPTVTAWILIAIGAGFILTSRFWLKNVYHRFMKRRYKNMEGFRDSRQ